MAGIKPARLESIGTIEFTMSPDDEKAMYLFILPSRRNA